MSENNNEENADVFATEENQEGTGSVQEQQSSSDNIIQPTPLNPENNTEVQNEIPNEPPKSEEKSEQSKPVDYSKGNKPKKHEWIRYRNYEQMMPLILNFFYCFYFPFICRVAPLREEDVPTIAEQDKSTLNTDKVRKNWIPEFDKYAKALNEYNEKHDKDPEFEYFYLFIYVYMYIYEKLVIKK